MTSAKASASWNFTSIISSRNSFLNNSHPTHLTNGTHREKEPSRQPNISGLSVITSNKCRRLWRSNQEMVLNRIQMVASRQIELPCGLFRRGSGIKRPYFFKTVLISSILQKNWIRVEIYCKKVITSRSTVICYSFKNDHLSVKRFFLFFLHLTNYPPKSISSLDTL